MNRRAVFKMVLAVVASTMPRRLLAASRYPDVDELERGLGLYPGAQLPKEVVADGRVYEAFYVSGQHVGNGRYAALIELRPRR